jgi:hypothetical protein
MGCLAAGTFYICPQTCHYANKEGDATTGKESTLMLMGMPRPSQGCCQWKYTLCCQGMRGTLPWDVWEAWPLVLYIWPCTCQHFTKGMSSLEGNVRCRLMRTHVRSPLEVHALSSGKEGDSTMGCLGSLAAGTLHLATHLPTLHQGDVVTARERTVSPDENACEVATGSTRFVVRG